MFSGILFFALVVISGFFTIMWKKEEKYSGTGYIFCTLAIGFMVATIVVISTLTLGKYSYQIADFSEVRGLKMKITLLEERREKLTFIIENELKKYPEIEKDIISKIGSVPLFFMNYPQLKSNETIIKTVNDIVEINDQVYNIRGLFIETLQRIYLREISPWTIYVKTYERFFKEKNPIL